MYVSSLPAQVTTSICGWRVERAQKNSRNAKSLSGNCVKPGEAVMVVVLEITQGTARTVFISVSNNIYKAV